MNDRTVIVAACLLAGGLFFALRALDTVKPDAVVATPAGCDCGTAETADGKNSVFPIEDLPVGASNIKSLGNGWLQFQVDLAGYRRVFIYRRGGALTELSREFVGTGAAPAKPGASGSSQK